MKEVRVIITIDAEELESLGFIEQPDAEEVTNAIHALIDRQRTDRICCKCGHDVFISDVEGYSYVCYNCDENLYRFETEDKEEK